MSGASNLKLLRGCDSDAVRLQVLYTLQPLPPVDKIAETFVEDLYIFQAVQYCAPATAQLPGGAALAAATLGRVKEDVYRLRTLELFLNAKLDLAPVAVRIAASFADAFYAAKTKRLLGLTPPAVAKQPPADKPDSAAARDIKEAAPLRPSAEPKQTIRRRRKRTAKGRGSSSTRAEPVCPVAPGELGIITRPDAAPDPPSDPELEARVEGARPKGPDAPAQELPSKP
jgi:hypothetical protein